MGSRPAYSTCNTAMELSTPTESLRYAALDLERAVLKIDQTAIACDINAIRLRVAQQETRLTLIRYHQAQNKLAQAVQEINQTP